MSHRSRGSDIFSKESRWKDNAFVFENQEMKQQIQLSKSNAIAAPSAMKKFGNYVPKILVGETDFVERENIDTRKFMAPKVTAKSQSTSSSALKNSLQPNLWVVGDKHSPVVLNILNNTDDDHGRIKESQPGELRKTNIFTQNEMSNVNKSQRPLSKSTGNFHSNFTKFDATTEGIFEKGQNTVQYTEDNYLTAVSTSRVTDIARNAIFRAYGKNETEQEKIRGDVMIPAADYDQEEQAAYFNSEEFDCRQVDGNTGYINRKRPVKLHDGADFSMFLNDDDTKDPVVTTGHQLKARKTLAGIVKSESGKPKLSDKYFFFKQSPQITNTRKLKGKKTVVVANSVRNFSYADTKTATMRKGHLDFVASVSNNTHDDGDRYLQANEHKSSYELYLLSRHCDVSQEQPASRDGSAGVFGGGQVKPSHNRQHTVWKKLTLRLKGTLRRTFPGQGH